LVDIVSSSVPFILLRPLAAAHSSAAAAVPNHELVVDRPIQAYTTLLAGAIYCVTLSTAYKTFLPRTLVVYFSGIPSIEPARSATTFLFVSTPALVLSLLFGLAARTFIFTPVATTDPSQDDVGTARFDPMHATLRETLWWNLWGYSSQGRASVVRTGAAVLATALRTYLSCTITINGIDSYGAAVYASVWAFAAFLTGVGLGFVGRA
jgi:hypothetical protein